MQRIITLATILLTFSSYCFSQTNPIADSKVVKIIKTKAFSAKQNFDKLVVAQPAYDMGYDMTIGMDFSWSIKHFDKFGNIVKLISFMVDKYGVEKILETTNYSYYSPKEHKLSIVKTKGDLDLRKTNVIRDDEGKRIKEEMFLGAEMHEKKVYTYNETSQRIKEDLYRKNGIFETIEYTYDSPSLVNGKVILEVIRNFKHNYTYEYFYSWSNEGELISRNFKHYENEILKAENITNYNSYINKIATEEVTVRSRTDDLSIKTTDIIERVLNEKNDIIKYSETISIVDVDINEQKSGIRLRYPIQDIKVYSCDYTYNKRGDWEKLLFSADNSIAEGNSSFLIFREIQYFE
jgi:hypothetical protein